MLNSYNKKSMAVNFKQQGFLSMPNDSVIKTLLVAISLCLICSIVVSAAAIMLKPIQIENKQLDKKKNILAVAGIENGSEQGSSKSIDELFSQIETKVVDLATGEYTTEVDAETFDQRKASKDPAYRVALTSRQDIAQIGGLSKYANVYLVRDGDQGNGKVSKFILPIKGYGLWSTLYGFLCLESDAQTACGINFYEHNETPGLGGEVDNPAWQALWQGKQIFNQQGMAEITLIKGRVEKNTADAQYKIDGLAGATLTSKGVTNLVRFWVGENGFGPYLQTIQSEQKNKHFREKQQEKQQLENKQRQQQAITQKLAQQKLSAQESSENEQQKGIELQNVESEALDVQTDNQSIESKIIESDVVKQEKIEPKADKVQATENQIIETEIIDTQLIDTEANYGE